MYPRDLTKKIKDTKPLVWMVQSKDKNLSSTEDPMADVHNMIISNKHKIIFVDNFQFPPDTKSHCIFMQGRLQNWMKRLSCQVIFLGLWDYDKCVY